MITQTEGQVMQEKIEKMKTDLRDRSESVDPISSSEVLASLALLSLTPEDREEFFEIAMNGYHYNQSNIENATEWFLIADVMGQYCY